MAMNLLFSYFSPFLFFDILLSLCISVFLIFRKPRTKASFWLTFYCGIQFIGFLAYFLSHSMLEEWILPYRRFGTGLLIFGICGMVAFAYHFPRCDTPKEAKFVTIISFFISTIVYTHFEWISFTSEKVFEFDTHTHAYPVSTGIHLGITTLMLFVFSIIIFIRKLFRFKDEKERYAILNFIFLLIGFIMISFTNAVMRAGIISIEVFAYIYYFSVPLAIYFMAVIYINQSEEPTSFMVKIVGIFLTTVLLIACFLGELNLSEKEKEYDRQIITEIDLLRQNNFIPQKNSNIEYILQMQNNMNKPLEDNNFLYFKKSIPNRELLQKEMSKESQNLQYAKRYYRKLGNGLYIYFRILENDNISEIGYSYPEYRKIIHPVSYKIILSMLFIFFGVILFYPMLFHRSLVAPLNNLLAGMRKVNSGDLNIKVGIKYNDEIGYLTNSFNNMITSIRESKEKLEDYAENLEKKVDERTFQLNEKMNEVQTLKDKQDGDYFLTTLLIEPLMANKTKSKNFKVDFFIEQKKKFFFKNIKHQLGGDICISGDLNFSGEKYVFFFNGDAMGKSMQGAGGALVIGSVLNSIMARSASSGKILKSISPVEWMLETHLELQKVMEAFDGSMLVSCIIGLVNEESGRLYYFNAEHPFSILFRDKKATYIENEINVAKLGMPMQKGFSYHTSQLRKNDIIFIGSDGKDDVSINGIINEDENFFLKYIEEANGEMGTIYKLISQKGEIIDDFSLVKVTFHG